MEYHKGRLLDHVHLRVRDVEASRRFYRAITEALGIPFGSESESHFAVDELFVSGDGDPTAGVHLAFQAEDESAVERFYEAGLTAGGEDNGRPGPRDYHPGYFAAYLFDPDGNNVEAVYHGPAERSAPSVSTSTSVAPGSRGAWRGLTARPRARPAAAAVLVSVVPSESR